MQCAAAMAAGLLLILGSIAALTSPASANTESSVSSSGANGDCPGGPYCATETGSPSQNGNGNGGAVGEPCAGCVGNADNQNPPGQLPDGSDGNNGYECDGNNGIGKSNPAHTGCSPSPSPSPTETVSPTPTATVTESPLPSGSPSASSSPIVIVDTSSPEPVVSPPPLSDGHMDPVLVIDDGPPNPSLGNGKISLPRTVSAGNGGQAAAMVGRKLSSSRSGLAMLLLVAGIGFVITTRPRRRKAQ